MTAFSWLLKNRFKHFAAYVYTLHVNSLTRHLQLAYTVYHCNALSIATAWIPLLIYVAVPGRNRRLFRYVFRSHYHVRSALVQNFRYGRGSYMPYAMCERGKYSWVYPAHMSPTLNGSSVLERFKCRNTIEICNGIMFNFYLGLPHIIPVYTNTNPLR